ncbi:MAG: hypothetical protein V2J62_04800 [candidate division KSB1 bacterium]|jgi:hypothetical protein|nr:hypothetical protein [candidate division KSB1 bacterium]
MHDAGKRVILWRAGSKAVSFLTTLDLQDEIQYAVDVNPYKHGTFTAGTGHKVVPPDHLTLYPPDIVIVMNSIYLHEIRNIITRMPREPEYIPL